MPFIGNWHFHCGGIQTNTHRGDFSTVTYPFFSFALSPPLFLPVFLSLFFSNFEASLHSENSEMKTKFCATDMQTYASTLVLVQAKPPFKRPVGNRPLSPLVDTREWSLSYAVETDRPNFHSQTTEYLHIAVIRSTISSISDRAIGIRSSICSMGQSSLAEHHLKFRQ